MKRLILALALFSAPVFADKIDDAKYILTRPEVAAKVKAIGEVPSADGRRSYNVPWAVDTWLASLGAPVVVTPTPTPDPVIPGATKIADNASFQAALRDGASLELAPGRYTLNLNGRKNVSITGTAGVTFGEWSKIANSSNITISSVDFVQSSSGDASSVLLSPSNVDGLTLRGVNFIGQPGGYGFAIFAKDASTKNVRVEGGSAKRLEYAFRFNQAQGLFITGFAFSELTADGVQLGGNSRDVTVTRSTFRDWKPARGSHPDALQMVCAAYNITFSFNDIDANTQGANQFANATACPGVGSTNVIVEGNRFKLGGYANAVYLGNSTGRVTGNQLFKATHNPMIRIVGGSVSVSGNTLNGKPM